LRHDKALATSREIERGEAFNQLGKPASVLGWFRKSDEMLVKLLGRATRGQSTYNCQSGLEKDSNSNEGEKKDSKNEKKGGRGKGNPL